MTAQENVKLTFRDTRSPSICSEDLGPALRLLLPEDVVSCGARHSTIHPPPRRRRRRRGIRDAPRTVTF